MEENTSFESQFNSSQLVSMEVFKLRQMANSYYIGRDIQQAFMCLKSIKHTISAVLTKEELDDLRTIENQYGTKAWDVQENKPRGFDMPTRKLMLSLTGLSKVYEAYSLKINECLQNHKLLLKEAEETVKFRS